MVGSGHINDPLKPIDPEDGIDRIVSTRPSVQLSDYELETLELVMDGSIAEGESTVICQMRRLRALCELFRIGILMAPNAGWSLTPRGKVVVQNLMADVKVQEEWG